MDGKIQTTQHRYKSLLKMITSSIDSPSVLQLGIKSFQESARYANLSLKENYPTAPANRLFPYGTTAVQELITNLVTIGTATNQT